MSSQAFKRQHTIKELSAFNVKLYEPLSVDYYLNYAGEVSDLLANSIKVRPKLYQTLDAFDLFYFDVEKLAEELKKPPKTLWQKLVQQTLTSERFRELNKVTKGNVDLTIVSAYQFLKSIFEHAKWNKQLRFDQLSNQLPTNKNELKKIEEMFRKVTNEILENVKEMLEGYTEWKETNELIKGLIPDASYSHDALSFIRLAERPYEVRKRIKMLRDLLNTFKMFTKLIPSSFSRSQVEDIHGIVSGVTQIKHLRQIAELMPQELAFPKYFLALRIITNTATVRARAISITPVVFIDKSGSMGSYMPRTDITKISCACGFGLVLYKQYNAKIYFFDTEVHEVKPKDIVNTLLTIEADGGTNITNVLQTIEKMPRNNLYIIITDGIDDVDVEYAKKIASQYKIVFCIIPPQWETEWLKYFKVVKVNKPEDFVKSLTITKP